MLRVVSAFVVLVAAAGCETAGSVENVPGPAAAQASASKDAAPVAPQKGGKKVCRNIAVTGSRMPVKECKTEDEWERADAGGKGLDRPEVQPQ